MEEDGYPTDEVDPRSGQFLLVLALVLPMTVLLLLLCGSILNDVLHYPRPPGYTGEPQIPRDNLIVGLIFLGVLALFFSWVSARLIAAVVRGRSSGRLLPRWLAIGLALLLTGLPFFIAGVGLVQGDASLTLRGLLYSLVFAPWLLVTLRARKKVAQGTRGSLARIPR